MKRIPSELPDAIAALAPDLVVLTEYVHGTSRVESRVQFLCDLDSIGLKHTCVSSYLSGQNQVLVASRHRLKEGAIRARAIHESVPSNVIHVCLPENGLEILGLRVPDFSKEPAAQHLRRRCWDWITTIAGAVRDRPFVILGDFNTDPSYPPARCGDRIAALIEMGWQHAPSGATFWSLKGHPVRIDHAFASQHLTIGMSRAIRQIGPYLLAAGPGAFSDHAALSVDISSGMEGPGYQRAMRQLEI